MHGHYSPLKLGCTILLACISVVEKDPSRELVMKSEADSLSSLETIRNFLIKKSKTYFMKLGDYLYG